MRYGTRLIAAVVAGVVGAGAGRAAEPGSPGAFTPRVAPAAPPAATPSPPPVVKDFTPALFPPPDEHAAAPAGCVKCVEDDHHEGGLFARAEYLLLRPRRGAFDFALVDARRDLVPVGRLDSLNYSLRSGARINLGYQLPGQEWDVLAGFTFLRSAAEKLVSAPGGGVLYPTLTRPGLTDQAVTAQANANLEYNVFDLEIGHRIHASERVSARVFGGARWVSIRQDFDARYNGLDARNALVRTKSSFDGFGPVLGGEGTIGIARGFHVYGRGSAGLLTGQSSSPMRETNDNGATTYAELDYRTHMVVPTVGLGIGAGWQGKRVSVRVGYEVTHYFGLIDQPRFTDDAAEGKVMTRPGDFSLEGLFFQFGLSF